MFGFQEKKEFGHLDSAALIEDDETLTYRELLQEADLVVGSIPHRSLVLFMADNTSASLIAYIGFLRNEIVPLMVKNSLSEKTLSLLITDYSPSFIWAQNGSEIPGETIYAGRGHTLISTGLVSPQMDSELALLLTTSGSTGSQKYVRLSYLNIESNARSIIECLGILPSDRAITTLPFSYSYGISIINSHLLAGASIVLTECSLFERAFWNLVATDEVTTFGGVPYTYQMLMRLHFDRMDQPSLRYLTQAGGRLGTALHEKFGSICQAKGIGFTVMYGQTEGTARLSYLPADRCLDKVGSIGIPIPGGKFELIDTEGRPVTKTGTSGELVYHGLNVSLGYATRKADLCSGDVNRGVLATGDIAQRDDEGFYYIIGRKKRFLKIFGNRVNLDEVETLLGEGGYVAACVGEDDSMVIYIEEGDKTAVQTFVSESTGLYHGAFRVVQIDRLPRNAAGKILYSELES